MDNGQNGRGTVDRRDFFKAAGAGLTAAAVILTPREAALAQEAAHRAAPYAHTNVLAKYWDRWGDKNDVQRSTRIMLAAGSRAPSRSSTSRAPSTGSKARSTFTKKG